MPTPTDKPIKVTYGRTGNYSNSAKRSRDGRKGRGVDAFTAKRAASMKVIERRIDRIVERERGKPHHTGSTLPIHAEHKRWKATKF